MSTDKQDNETALPEGDDIQAMLDASVIQDIFHRPTLLLGRELRPITLASLALLKEVKSPLIAGVDVETIQNVIIDSCIFVLLHIGTIEEAADLAFGPPSRLKLAALKLAEEVPAAASSSITDSIIELLRSATSTQVKAEPKEGDETGDPGNS